MIDAHMYTHIYPYIHIYSYRSLHDPRGATVGSPGGGHEDREVHGHGTLETHHPQVPWPPWPPQIIQSLGTVKASKGSVSGVQAI